MDRAKWQVPPFETALWQGKQCDYCVVIPVVNEGPRIKNLLAKMALHHIDTIADIIIVDGGSTDGSLNLEHIQKNKVRGLLIKKGPGELSAQLRCAYAFAMDQQYQGVVTIDGNDKDDPAAIAHFIEALKKGVDFVQASRFIPGGQAINTPKFRDWAIRFVHAPLLRVCSGFRWTDTTQGFRAYSRNLLLDPKVAPFRDVFMTYELLAYLSWCAPRLDYYCLELPTIRRYPRGKVPTKIRCISGNILIFWILLKTCLGFFSNKRIDRSEIVSL